MNIVKISDGLGNQMFQYAFARKLSIITGQNVYLDLRFINNEDFISIGQNVPFYRKLSYREYGLSHFKTILPIAGDKELLCWNYLKRSNDIQKMVYRLSLQDMWIWKYREENSNFSGEFSPMVLAFPTYYQGYFFDLKYYDDMKGVLRREFSLKQKINLPRSLRMMLDKREVVSLHVRRGDFLKLNRDISSSAYYERAMHIIESKVTAPVYFIFSDDIAWVKENMDVHGEKVYISEMGFQDYEEFTIMKHCKHNIIANSTFSYWAAYLNADTDKIVICPKHWRKNIIPNEWICV